MGNDLTDGSVAGNVESDSDSDSHDEHQPSQDLLMRSLRYWATSYSISLVALSALLSILKLFHPMLPKDGRTLLRTQHDVATTQMQGGEYYHFGLVQGILSRLKCLSLPVSLRTLTLQFNIDGLPLFKSSRLQFWPILAILKCDYTKSPFIVDEPVLQKIHTDGPLPQHFGVAVQYTKVSSSRFTLSTKQGDNCIEVGHSIAVVQNIVQEEDEVYVIYKRFRHQESYYTYPCESSCIGTYKVRELCDNIGVGKLGCIKRKCVLYPESEGNGLIAIPIAHMQ
ncbi:hypothetical protein F7725_012284 [Dissostichus mawsoni]|uniref:Uncharacterized protein n=1 Tax=Dissostichus mawsoni TaxID=36200 RepID=A0A7J5XCV3_DISMA|nr:hypothetical protein F7725_025591 [Dissostichus mawsoni]KAF3850512.1 hypothetical protein F7725_012284 [Dissostichus mawsoni]